VLEVKMSDKNPDGSTELLVAEALGFRAPSEAEILAQPCVIEALRKSTEKTARTLQNVLRSVGGGNDRAIEIIQAFLDYAPEYGGDPNRPEPE
jgi:hypothetical protein